MEDTIALSDLFCVLIHRLPRGIRHKVTNAILDRQYKGADLNENAIGNFIEKIRSLSVENLETNGKTRSLIDGWIKEAKDGSWRERIWQEAKKWTKRGIRLISILNPNYPPLLRNIYDPPPVLFFRGQDSSVLNKESCSVVGSRNSDRSSSETGYIFGEHLAQHGIAVVSGLAIGIDTSAHCGALNSGCKGSTVAVLGNGLYTVYPQSNSKIASLILESGGALISQFEPDMPPYPSNFLERNRVIAGISRCTVVVQAGLRSGALATARYAIEEGRDVLVAPGPIRNARYQGSNNLIKQGATLVTEAEDILEYYPDIDGRSVSDTPNIALSQTQLKIVSLLKERERMLISELEEMVTSSEIRSELLNLELMGIISFLPGNQVSLSSI